MLDVGYAHAVAPYLAGLTAAAPGEVTASTSSRRTCPGSGRSSRTCARCRSTDDSFDVAFCISTLEHVGADNARYGAADGGARRDGRPRSASSCASSTTAAGCSSPSRAGRSRTSAGTCACRPRVAAALRALRLRDRRGRGVRAHRRGWRDRRREVARAASAPSSSSAACSRSRAGRVATRRPRNTRHTGPDRARLSLRRNAPCVTSVTSPMQRRRPKPSRCESDAAACRRWSTPAPLASPRRGPHRPLRRRRPAPAPRDPRGHASSACASSASTATRTRPGLAEADVAEVVDFADVDAPSPRSRAGTPSTAS